MISVVLNAYKRKDLLIKQIDSCAKQSIPISEIVIWNNGDPINGKLLSEKFGVEIIVVNASKNIGVWARFSVALNCKSEFILILDDDVFPGKDFVKNCLDSFNRLPGLYGSRGLRFISNNRYEPYKEYSWAHPNESIQQVDIVGHSWFFPKEYLNYFWRENFSSRISPFCGEDIHFSYMLQKFGGIQTYVPPHPSKFPDMWGTCPEESYKIGADCHAISQQSGAMKKFDFALKFYAKKGFKLILPDKLKVEVEGVESYSKNWREWLMCKMPFFFRLLVKIKRNVVLK